MSVTERMQAIFYHQNTPTPACPGNTNIHNELHKWRKNMSNEMTVCINLENEEDMNVVLNRIDECLQKMPIGQFEVYRK